MNYRGGRYSLEQQSSSSFLKARCKHSSTVRAAKTPPPLSQVLSTFFQRDVALPWSSASRHSVPRQVPQVGDRIFPDQRAVRSRTRKSGSRRRGGSGLRLFLSRFFLLLFLLQELL